MEARARLAMGVVARAPERQRDVDQVAGGLVSDKVRRVPVDSEVVPVMPAAVLGVQVAAGNHDRETEGEHSKHFTAGNSTTGNHECSPSRRRFSVVRCRLVCLFCQPRTIQRRRLQDFSGQPAGLATSFADHSPGEFRRRIPVQERKNNRHGLRRCNSFLSPKIEYSRGVEEWLQNFDEG